MKKMMSSFKTTMRYQLATFCQPDGEIPLDPRDMLSRQRAQSMELLTNVKRKMSTDKTLESRDRVQSKAKQKGKKLSTGYKVQVEKSNDAKPPASAMSPVTSEVKPEKAAAKKTKRRAPAPPSSLSGKQNVKQEPGSNPFEDEEGSNPFLEGEDEDSGNPFLDEGDVDSGNPFLGEEEDTGNPFLDDGDDEKDPGNPFL